MKTLVVLAALVLTATAADATPGAVNAQGCHGHPRHCHGAGELMSYRNGRHFVPGHFDHTARVSKSKTR